MLAPNGARHTKSDHPNLPISIEEIAKTAKAGFLAGADGIHAHIRDKNGKHSLDTGIYRELLDHINHVVPEIEVQITTEAVGIYRAEQQIQLIEDIKPKLVSVALREITNGDVGKKQYSKFYHSCLSDNIAVQHILYDKMDLLNLINLRDQNILPNGQLDLLFVLGKYGDVNSSKPQDLQVFLNILTTHNVKADWMVCAFGVNEIDCLVTAHKLGGKMRIGFENSLWNKDGSLATSNEQRVTDLIKAIN